MYEKNPEADYGYISPRARAEALLMAKVALFDEMIDFHLDGVCTFDEAVDQYKHDLQFIDI